jgi:hypothetical protein
MEEHSVPLGRMSAKTAIANEPDVLMPWRQGEQVSAYGAEPPKGSADTKVDLCRCMVVEGLV